MPTPEQIGQLVTAVDDILVSDNAPTYARALYETLPVALRDQLTAAVADTHSMGTALDYGPGTTHGHIAPGACPAWVRLGAAMALANWAAGRSRTCVHDPRPDRPQPLAAAAWRPDLITCRRCTHLLALPKRSPRNFTCDGCGTVSNRHVPISIGYGALLYMLGVCPDCRFGNDDTVADT